MDAGTSYTRTLSPSDEQVMKTGKKVLGMGLVVMLVIAALCSLCVSAIIAGLIARFTRVKFMVAWPLLVLFFFTPSGLGLYFTTRGD